MIVVDSSVALKWFLDEEGTETALALLWREDFAAPDLLIYELINGLVYKRSLTISDIKDSLNKLMKLDIEFLVLTGETIARTAEIARHFNLSAYDASFVALAEKLNINFITADSKLVQRVKGLSFVRHLSD
jgi:predicted nucleic acid-binding protein